MDPRLISQRLGYSLLEMVMAATILATITLTVVDGMTAMSVMATQVESETNLATEAQEILSLMTEDIAQSGWHFPGFNASLYDVEESNFGRTLDRNLIYFPYVHQQCADDNVAFEDFAHPLKAGAPRAVTFNYAAVDAGVPNPATLKRGLLRYNFAHLNRQADLVNLARARR